MAEQKQLTVVQALSMTKTNVQNQIENYCKNGKLNLPQNYSAGNALNLLQLKIQDDAKVMACTQASIAKVMLDMCILGLNISKTQCYVIPYGTKAQLSVSYLGKVAIAKRIDPTIENIFGRVVKDGEEFDFEDNLDGGSKILKHKRTLQSLNSKDILAAYATIVYNDGKEPKSLIMSFDRIKQSWEMSTMKPVDDKGNVKKGSTHDKFMEDMCIKTVISAICKPIISTSNDGDLFNEALQSVELEEKSAQAHAQAKENMCKGEFVDVEFSDVKEIEPEPQQTAEPEKPEQEPVDFSMFEIDKDTGEVKNI